MMPSLRVNSNTHTRLLLVNLALHLKVSRSWWELLPRGGRPYCEGIDGILEAVSFADRCAGAGVPQPATRPGHLYRLLAVHRRLPSGQTSVGGLSAACNTCIVNETL